jgi:hypothetical protein
LENNIKTDLKQGVKLWIILGKGPVPVSCENGDEFFAFKKKIGNFFSIAHKILASETGFCARWS